MPTRGGTFRHLVELQSRSTTQGALGGQTEVWTTYATVYAAINPLNGGERLAAQAAQSELTHEMQIYWSPGFTPAAKDRAVLGSRVFDIRAAWNDNEEDRVWVLQVTEGMTQG